MSDRDSYGWANVEPEHLAKLGTVDFERFCFDLVKFEAYDRHDAPKLDGPAGGPGTPDGGRDVLLTISKPPPKAKLDYQREFAVGPLTEDDLGRTAYSCKGGNNWLTLALRDVEKRKKPGRSIEVLLEGGHFKLLISVHGKLDESRVKRAKTKARGKTTSATPPAKTPHTQLRDALWERMRKIDPKAPDPGARIEILDADALTGFLRARRPEAGAITHWADVFGTLPLLQDLAAWRAQHRVERAEPRFVEDAVRKKLQGELFSFLTTSAAQPEDRAAWLVGPPGVGKTRLIIESLEAEPSIAQRVRVAWSPQEAQDALVSHRLVDRYPTVVLIIDDCPASQVDDLVSRFMRGARPDSNVRVIVITPASADVTPPRLARRWTLGTLAESATRQLAADELGSQPESEDSYSVAKLSEGYPWFATLLAEEARKMGRAPRDLNEAVQWALASKWESSTELEANALRLRRARCLLASSLTRRVDWERLSEEVRASVAAAVGLPRWQDVFDGARECVKRGILRQSLGWQFKYVTPLVLEREVITMLLGPNGTDPGGRTLTRHGKSFVSDFYETLARLNLSADTIESLAAAAISDLNDTKGWVALNELGLLGSRLLFTARHAPAPVARALNELVQRTDVAELRARTGERRGVMFALEGLITEPAAFGDAEAALFRLAQAENETYANNATNLWESIYLPVGMHAARPLEERMALLERRLSDDDPVARQVAVGGLNAVVTDHLMYRVTPTPDFRFSESTGAERAIARAQAWKLLANRAADLDVAVAQRARSVLTSELRGAVRSGSADVALAAITSALPSFSNDDRIELRDRLAAVRAYDDAWLEPHRAAFDALERLVLPSTYGERLRQRVGAWGPAAERKLERDAPLDDAIASEGLAGDAPLLDELAWLVSERAVRGHVFAYAMGRCDEERVLWEPLRTLARSNADWMRLAVCARYIAGHAQAGRAEAAANLLDELQLDAHEANIFALGVVELELGADDARLESVIDVVRSGLLTSQCVLELARRRDWLEGVSPASFVKLVEALLADDAPEHAAAALELVVARSVEATEDSPDLQALLVNALDRTARQRGHGMTDYYFERGAVRLANLGEAKRAAELVVTALLRSKANHDHAWKALRAICAHDPHAGWQAVARALEGRDAATGHLLLAFRFQRHSFDWPADDVLAWVGSDERRARAAGSIVHPSTSNLSPVHRGLIQRFGATSSTANEIMSRIQSTKGFVSSLAAHDREQLERARPLLGDPEPEVQAFACRLVASLTKSLEQHTALEEDERRRWGT